jgi:mRNA-degrading endonuclease RelE of RelBE toxin-antitoxin system
VVAPLHELSRDQLSVFLYVTLLPEETRAIVREQGISVPGFRSEALGDVERCDVLADEIRADPPFARVVLAALERALREPPLGGWAIDPRKAEELLDVGASDAALALLLWRVLSDAREEVRRAALPLLDELAHHYFGPAPDAAGAGEGAAAPPPPERGAPGAEQALARAEERVRKAEARAEEQRRKAEEQRERLQASLKEARARESAAVDDAARAREEAEASRQEAGRLRAEAEALRSSDAVADAARARAEARELAGRVTSLESRLERSREREAELETELERTRAAQAAGRAAPVAPSEPGGSAAEDAAEEASWLRPVYTREFYDSLEGWDRRVQRAAFKQAHLLATDHRHPSLRALPLEGLPGYYRVRVATDVRLIYRRAERQNEVEILSLIDREDLDRYIRQAKTRG